MAKSIFRSKVEWSGEGVRSIAESRGKQFVIDEPQALGGSNQGQTPVEVLLSALGGCLNVLITSFAPMYEVEVRNLTVLVEGDLDPDGFLGKNPDVRPGFSEIRYQVQLDSPSDEAKIDALLQHAERVCPVKDTLKGVKVALKTSLTV